MLAASTFACGFPICVLLLTYLLQCCPLAWLLLLTYLLQCSLSLMPAGPAALPWEWLVKARAVAGG
jgi:hypothetical protein